MYAFKIVTTTLMSMLMISLLFSGLKSAKKGKMVSGAMILIVGMGIVASWG